MSVVPFNEAGSLNGPGSYTRTTRDFSISGGAVLILDMDETQLASSDRDGNATYSFRVGSEFKDHDDLDITTVGPGDSISIRPGKAVIIKTLEFVHFPSGRYGLILPKVSLLQKGLSTVASKVDPGYQGNLAITMFNHGKRTVELRPGHQFCSLTLFEVGGSVRMYEKPPKGLIGAGKGWYKKTRDLVYRYITYVVYAYVLFQILSFFVKSFGIWQFVRPYLRFLD